MGVRQLLLAVSAITGACAGDHDFLAQKGGGTGGAADASSAVDVVGDESRSSRLDAADASFEARGPDVIDELLPPEPPGRFTFTVTNGLVDARSARLCFVPVVKGQEQRDKAVLLPLGAFGTSLILTELVGIDRSTMDVRPYAVVQDGTEADAGLACADMLDASAPGDGPSHGPFVAALPLIPAGTLAEARSYLGVATGCVRPWPFSQVEAGTDGGDANPDVGAVDGSKVDVFQPPARAAICGAAGNGPSAGLVLVRLSQRDVGRHLGMQAVHATTAVSGARVAVVRATGAVPIFSADIGPYQISPRDAPTAIERGQFGPTPGAASVQVGSLAGAFATITFSLATAFTASGIDEAALQDGDAFSLVLIGAEPGQDPGPPWNASRIAVVRNAPLSGGD